MGIRFGTSAQQTTAAEQPIFWSVRPVYEMPVDFKFSGELINEDKAASSGEEPSGMSVEGYYPEKDGILACLLATKAVATRDAYLSDMNELKYIFADNSWLLPRLQGH